MAYGILVLFFVAAALAQSDYNPSDPNLFKKRDGAMDYGHDQALDNIKDTTGGALIIEQEPLKFPKKKKQDPETKK